MPIATRIPGSRPLAFVGIAILLGACTNDPTVRVTQVGGRAVEFALQGQGSPPIVFESGLGDDLSPWREVASTVAGRTTSLSYSRAGYGRSAKSRSPRRDQRVVAAELDELLSSLKLPAPYILVGHSLGGVYVQAYAAAYPQKVAGLVLVEPMHPDQATRANRESPVDARIFRILSRLFTDSMRAEFQALENMTAFPQQVFTGPVIVLAAEHKQMLATDDFHRLRGTLLQDIAAHYPRGELRWIDAGHYIHRESPEAVVDAIDTVIDRLGERRLPDPP